jgi:hypothetical protein
MAAAVACIEPTDAVGNSGHYPRISFYAALASLGSKSR